MVCRKQPCRSRPGPDRPEAGRPGGLSNGRGTGAGTVIWTFTTSDVPVCLFAPLGMVSKPKSSAPPAEPERARRRSSHDSSCSRGPKGPTRCPEHLSSPSPLPATGEHATLGGGGRSCSVRGPRLLGARDCLWGLCGPAVDDLHGPAQPGGSPAKWEATTSCPGSSSLGRALPCRHGPRAAWARGHPAAWTAGGTHPALAGVTLRGRRGPSARATAPAPQPPKLDEPPRRALGGRGRARLAGAFPGGRCRPRGGPCPARRTQPPRRALGGRGRPRLAGAFPGALCRRSATGSPRWHTQPLRGNLGCHRHPRHAGAFPGALCR